MNATSPPQSTDGTTCKAPACDRVTGALDPATNISHLAVRHVEPPACRISKPIACTIEAFLSEAECSALIDITEAEGYGKALVNIGGGRQMYMDDVRRSKRCMIDSAAACEVLWSRLQPVLEAHKLMRMDGWEAVGLNERLRFLKYTPGDYFAPHQDGRYARPAGSASGERGDVSFMTLMLYLNAPQKGGATNFLDDDEDKMVSVKPKAGLALLFQHNLLHEGARLDVGVKYAIRTDIMFRRVDRIQRMPHATGCDLEEEDDLT